MHPASRNKRLPGTQYIDPAKFVNKAVITEETDHFTPEHRFEDFQIDATLKKNVSEKGYSLPTPIQDRAIPHVLKGSDVVGIAQTGTGKTAAFLLPRITKVLSDRRQQVLIVVPTRELALQIDGELKEFVKGMRVFSVCCVGGVGLGAQMSALRHPNQFVIGTPGRLKDLVERKMIRLKEYQTIVLDEADRMLDMGFIRDMRAIMAAMPSPRQTLFFSATLSPEIEKLIHEFLKDPVRIKVATQIAADSIDQNVVRIPPGGNKFDVLTELLRQPDFDKVLVFGRTKHGVEGLTKKLVKTGIKAESIHGNKSQGKRQRALTLFKQDHVRVLVATDVAARGLDIRGVSHVINYDLPATHSDYVHRIGRTGRAGQPGKALTFLES